MTEGKHEAYSMHTIDEIMLAMDIHRERIYVLLSNVVPYFEAPSADQDKLTDIRIAYDEIRVFLDIAFESLHEMQKQLDRWAHVDNVPLGEDEKSLKRAV